MFMFGSSKILRKKLLKKMIFFLKYFPSFFFSSLSLYIYIHMHVYFFFLKFFNNQHSLNVSKHANLAKMLKEKVVFNFPCNECSWVGK